MSVIGDSSRIQLLLNQKIDLEDKIRLVAQTKAGLAFANSDLMQVGTDYSPDSPIVKQLNQRQAKLKVIEQKLDTQMEQYRIQLQMVETELNACRSRLRSGIGDAFRYA
ncbi:hypothetical protein IKU74_08915 [bacterium]|nr:hypothetical protein [bacterium]